MILSKTVIIIMYILLATGLQTYAQKVIDNWEALYNYAQQESYMFKSNQAKAVYAKNTVLAAKLNIVDFQAGINPSLVYNMKLPVNILPGEVFGGQPGSTKEIRTGTPYNVSVPFNAEVKLYNPGAWADYKLAKLNIGIVETDNKLNQKNLQENVMALYYNIIQLQEQQKVTTKNLATADTLLKVTERKYKAGLIKQQDVNDAKVNVVNTQENIQQIGYLIEQQILTLKSLADITDSIPLMFTESIDANTITPEVAIMQNNLSVNNFLQKEQYAAQQLKKANQVLLPSVSFVFNNANSQFSQQLNLIDNSWITSRYVGLKLNVALPNPQTISNKAKAKFDHQLAVNNTRQAAIKNKLDFQKLQVDVSKAKAQVRTNNEILQLQKDTYQKNRNLYTEGLQSIDKTLQSLNNWLQAEYNLVTSKISLALAKANININNKIQ
jgi:outer membrane protein TolC